MLFYSLEKLREVYFSTSPRTIVEIALDEFRPPTVDGVVIFDPVYGGFYADNIGDGEPYELEHGVVVFRMSWFGNPPTTGGYYDDFLQFWDWTYSPESEKTWEAAMEKWASYVQENLKTKWGEVERKYKELSKK